MTAVVFFALRDMNVLSIQSTKQDLKPILISVSAPASPQSPTLKDKRSMEGTATPQPEQLFPSAGASDELKDMRTLRRATPIFDEDDEEDYFESPTTKRSRSTFFDLSPQERDAQSSGLQELSWNFQIQEDENGFPLAL
jgi:hypothetical protein